MLGTREDFDLIRQQISIEAAASYLLKKQGRMYIYPGEKTASIRIYAETQSFYDFGITGFIAGGVCNYIHCLEREENR